MCFEGLSGNNTLVFTTRGAIGKGGLTTDFNFIQLADAGNSLNFANMAADFNQTVSYVVNGQLDLYTFDMVVLGGKGNDTVIGTAELKVARTCS